METVKQQFRIRGLALFPEREDKGWGECKKFCLAINGNERNKIIELCQKANNELEEINFGDVEFEDREYSGMNMKTYYDIPIYDINGKDITSDGDTFPINHGAEVQVLATIAEYKYKRNQKSKNFEYGLTCYLNGVIVLKQGEQKGINFEYIMNGEDDIEF